MRRTARATASRTRQCHRGGVDPASLECFAWGGNGNAASLDGMRLDAAFAQPSAVAALDDVLVVADTASGALRLSPLVTQVLPLVELRTALGMLETDADGRMKIVLEH